jgi:hypothetical protein
MAEDGSGLFFWGEEIGDSFKQQGKSDSMVFEKRKKKAGDMVIIITSIFPAL